MAAHSVFWLIAFTNILINLDHGILPACTTEIQDFYYIGEAQLGFLGSIVYLGIIVTGIFVGRLFQIFNSKRVILTGLVCLIGSLLLFVLSRNYWLACVSRFVTGGFQVFMLVYFPVWIDKNGGEKATLWITLLQIGVPLGIFAGYGMTSVVVQNLQWQYSFYIQIALVTAAVLVFFTLSNDILNVKESLGSEIDQHLLIKEGGVKKRPSYCSLLAILFKTKMYIIAIFTMSVMLFVSTGIQFWMTDYFIEVLGFDRVEVNIAYAVVSITGPTLGCAFGGYVVNAIGGYSEPRSIYFIFLFSVVGIGAGVIIPFVKYFWVVSILLWLVLFFGGAMVPGLTGMIMSSVQPQIRAFGNSKGEIIKNTFGYFPSPFLYGLVNKLTGNPSAGITLIMFWGLLAPLLLGIGSLITYRKGKKVLIQEHVADFAFEGSESEPGSPLKKPFLQVKESGETTQQQTNEQSAEATEAAQA